MTQALTAPELTWREDTPFSERYDDVYFSRSDGLAETRHVFLDGNDLAARLRNHPHPRFTIGETGFGTGLNLLAALRLWNDLPEPKPRLRYVTVDLHPLPREALARAHAHWPELAALSATLCAMYPPAYPGMHRRLLGEKVEVDFLWGGAEAMLAAYRPAFEVPHIDAWFLDGFSPAKNPHMWTPALYAQLARLSASGATLATFTSAGHVRRGLQAAGFAMRRRPGHGAKREMSCGVFQAVPTFSIGGRGQEAVVLGGGIAGFGAAWHLTRQGKQVRLMDAGDAPCLGASGNPASICTPYFTADWSKRGQAYASGFGQTMHLWEWLEARGHRIQGARCGTLVLQNAAPASRRQQERHAGLSLPETVMRMVSAREASEIAAVELKASALFYPQAGWLKLASLCEALGREMGEALTVQPRKNVGRIAARGEGWDVFDAEDRLLAHTRTLVLACGMGAMRLLPELRLHAVRGQVLALPADRMGALAQLRSVVRFGGYLTPAAAGEMILGATFDRGQETHEARTADSRALLEGLTEIFPDVEIESLLPEIRAWVGLRCNAPSRMPLMGELKPGLHLTLAHGARGSLSGLYAFDTL